MSINDSQQLANALISKTKNACHTLRDGGLSYLEFIEQITYLLFLKMDDEQSKPPYSKRSAVPAEYNWDSLLSREGAELKTHYLNVLEVLSHCRGMVGNIFAHARCSIQRPAVLRKIIVEIIGSTTWSSMEVDVKGTVYEGLINWCAQDVAGGAGQYFTPRPVIDAIVDVVRPTIEDNVCDPACGTGGFLLSAYNYVARHNGKTLNSEQKKHLRTRFVEGGDIVPTTARLCIMNLYLHGIQTEPCPIQSGVDSLATDPNKRYSVVLTNPPFGIKGSSASLNSDGTLEKEEHAYERQDFWVSTKNKQLNFVQHIKTLLKVNGRCGVVVPDNVLFEGGAGEVVRRQLLAQFDVHTLLRLPTGIFYKPGVKANVLFFDKKPAQEKPWTKRLWVYDLRSNMHFTQKTNPLQRSDLDEFVGCYMAGQTNKRKETWSESNPEGRWRSFDYKELVQRDKLSMDILWLKDKSLEDSDTLPPPDQLALDIADDLQAAWEQFAAIAEKTKS